MEMTHILVVSDLERARAFYRDVLGAEVYREYGGTSVVLNFQGAWLLLVTGGGPTDDKPTVTFAPPAATGRSAGASRGVAKGYVSASTLLARKANSSFPSFEGARIFAISSSKSFTSTLSS